MKKFIIFALLLACAINLAKSQSSGKYIIKGLVSDVSGQVLIGASVVEKGTGNGKVTDLDGTFNLTVQDSCVTLEIRYTGFESITTQACANGNLVLVKLLEGLTLDEVIVKGYASSRKRSVSSNRRSRKKRNKTAVPYTPTAPPLNDYTRPKFETEDYSAIRENTFFEVKKEPLSTFSIDVDAASYSNMRRFINNGNLPPIDAVRIEEMINYFNYDYPEPKTAHPFEVTTELGDCPWNEKHQLLHIGLQGKNIDTEQLPPSNLVFLIDVSGSMRDYNKLPLLKSSFELLTKQLRPQDKVAIVVYAGAAGVVLSPTPGNQKEKITKAIRALQSGGSTAGGAGIKKAYDLAKENFVEGGNNRVILATDGDFNVGVSSDSELIRIIEEKRKTGIFLTILGFGTGNYKDNKMQGLAQHGNGNHAYIDNIEEAQKVLIKEFGATMFTIAKDVKLQLEFNPAHVQAYRLIGYENRLLENEDFNDDQKDAGELGAGHTVTALYEIIPNGVESSFIKKVDPLKYQVKNSQNNALQATQKKELMTVKLRYKEPDGQKSKLLQHIQKAKSNALDKTSDNFIWAAAVAEFGMLLRNSEFKSAANFNQVIRLAKKAKGEDNEGYRAQFINMVRSVKNIKEPISANKTQKK